MRDPLFPQAPRRRSLWQRPVPSSAHRRFDFVLGALVAVFVVAWGFGIAEAAREGHSLTRGLTANPLSGPDPEAAFVLDALVDRFAGTETFRGRSGALNVIIPEPGEPVEAPDVPGEVRMELLPAGPGALDTTAAGVPASRPDTSPGVWALTLRSGGTVRTVPNLRVLTQLSMGAKEGGRVGEYRVGSWPFEDRAAREGYETPRGLIEVTPENVDLQVSEHFALGDFLTKGQTDVWPKYVVLSPALLDKLELTIQELEKMGHPVERAGVISGFRTPHYNAGGGNTSGRGDLSRHMYGDAMDFYIDNDGDGCLDDLNGDGRAGIGDVRIMAEAAERVEETWPDLVGGIGVYDRTGAHCGFLHVDTRGQRARW